MVLDVMLPGLDGWEVIRQLRAKRDVPIIFLSARDEVNDRIRGLRLGADDYLVKPFSFVELELRIRTILRRGSTREIEVFEVADLRLDVVRRKVTRDGVEIPLTNKEFMLLHLLLRRQGEVLNPHSDRLRGLGHEFRQRHQRRRRRGEAAAGQGRRAVRTQADRHRPQRRLLAQRGSVMIGAGLAHVRASASCALIISVVMVMFGLSLDYSVRFAMDRGSRRW